MVLSPRSRTNRALSFTDGAMFNPNAVTRHSFPHWSNAADES
jgi:hypothetical protein